MLPKLQCRILIAGPPLVGLQCRTHIAGPPLQTLIARTSLPGLNCPACNQFAHPLTVHTLAQVRVYSTEKAASHALLFLATAPTPAGCKRQFSMHCFSAHPERIQLTDTSRIDSPWHIWNVSALSCSVNLVNQFEWNLNKCSVEYQGHARQALETYILTHTH